MEAMIFDFNGTLVRDTDYHEQAWQQFIQELVGRKFTKTEFEQKVHGRNNHLVLEDILERKLSTAEGLELSNQKEAIYRKIAIVYQLTLIKGVPEYFDYLKEHDVLMNIATASPKVNVDFYFDRYDLSRWFSYDKVVYGDGSLPSKPAPDFYLQGALRVGGEPKEMTVFEDSYLGLQGAANAQAKRIIAVSTNDNQQALMESGVVDFVIDDFTDTRLKEFW